MPMIEDLEDRCPECCDSGTVGQQKMCLGCCGLASLISTIIFIVYMSAYHHLGPDDQIVVKSASGKEVVNGAQSVQLNPTKPIEWRKAPLLNPLQYAVVQDTLTGVMRHEVGPQLLFLGPYDELRSIEPKLVLEKDSYLRLVDKKTGQERVDQGPTTIVPEPSEYSPLGIEKAVFLDTDTAVVVLNKLTGLRKLVTFCTNEAGGVFVPAPNQEVVELRSLIHVLPFEAIIVRDVQGTTTVYSGAEGNYDSDSVCEVPEGSGQGTAFFLKPYDRIVKMTWSDYSEAPEARLRRLQGLADLDPSLFTTAVSTSQYSGPKVDVIKIDLRARKSFYDYEVRTNDNVKLRLYGTIFWQIIDVRKMINVTSDPEGDVWQKSRATLISAVSNVTFDTFMNGISQVVSNAFDAQAGDTFYTSRGIMLQSMELTSYSPSDEHTRQVLQQIIQETTNRINRLQKQRSDNDVRKEALEAEIMLENNRTQLIETQALNTRLLAETRGATSGGGKATSISAFIDGLEESLPNVTGRMELYMMHEGLASSNRDSSALSSGNASLFVAPKDMSLKLALPHSDTNEL